MVCFRQKKLDIIFDGSKYVSILAITLMNVHVEPEVNETFGSDLRGILAGCLLT